MQRYSSKEITTTAPPPSSSINVGGHAPPPKRKAGRRKFKETRHPIYKGVRRRNEKWVCEIRHPQNTKSRIWLGTFTCPVKAARAHDVAAAGRASLNLNFPESAHLLPRAVSGSVGDIRVDVLGLSNVETGGDGGSGQDDGGWVAAEPPGVFVDDEELFNMPALLNSMAEGLIITPPAMKRGFCWGDVVDGGGDSGMDFTLWNDD